MSPHQMIISWLCCLTSNLVDQSNLTFVSGITLNDLSFRKVDYNSER